MRKQITLPINDAGLLKARQVEIKRLKSAGWALIKNIGGVLIILEKNKPTADECFEVIRECRGGYCLNALLRGDKNQWGDLWQDYSEISNCAGDCAFTEAVERVESMVTQ